MATSRRNSNGRSPLVNPQRQITSFFTKSTSPSPSPSPILSNTKQKLNPNPSPTTPSPGNPKPHKPLLLIGASSSPSCPPSIIGQEVVGRRIKVYWPLDKAWYVGFVKSFDNHTSKHLVQYDDDEEESLDLSKEKIEWLQESSSIKLKRLRHGLPAFRQMVIEDDEKEESREDDSNDEDWGKNGVFEDSADGEEEDMELEEEEYVAEKAKGKPSGKVEPRKRKQGGGEKLELAKRSKGGTEVSKGGFKLSVLEPTSNLESK